VHFVLYESIFMIISDLSIKGGGHVLMLQSLLGDKFFFHLIYTEPQIWGTKISTMFTRAHSFGHILTKKHEISRTFGLKKCELLSWPSFGKFCQK
jgi:hypothetical protein